IGSTEWVETHAEDLSKKAVAYVNTDSNGRGFLGAAGSHTLERFVDEVARDVVDPETNASIAERQRARRLVRGSPESKKEAKEHPGLKFEALGSGSDYSPFLQHLGIASLNLGFGGESAGGSYHSAYDSFDHFSRFIDPRPAWCCASQTPVRCRSRSIPSPKPWRGTRRRWGRSRTSCATRPTTTTATSPRRAGSSRRTRRRRSWRRSRRPACRS